MTTPPMRSMRSTSRDALASNPQPLFRIPTGELERGQAMAWTFANETTDNPDLLDDLASEAMLGLIESAQRYEGLDVGKLTTFAYHRMRGRVLDAASKHARYLAIKNPPKIRQARARKHNPVKHVIVNTDRIRARIALQEVVAAARGSLDPREVFLLREMYSVDKPIAMVARQAGWSYGSTRRRHQSALNKLRRHARARHLEMIS